MGRAATRIAVAALLLFALTLAACKGGSGDPSPTPLPSPTPAPAVTPSPTPEPSDTPPDRDLTDLARRFRGLPADAPLTARDAPYDHAVGDRVDFNIIDIATPSLLTASATLRAVTEHAYFFVEDGFNISDEDLARLTSDFETTVYPNVTAAFGPVASPGVDGDPRIAIINADLRGAGGYVVSADGYPRAVAPRSNEREGIYMEASLLSSPGKYAAILAHELQHLVQANLDDSEEAWVNEGLSQVAAELAGGGTSSIGPFLSQPDTQLNDWTADSGVHYGESQLFFRYLLDRFGGRENAHALVSISEDGVAGVDAYLRAFDTNFETVFADFAVANYLDLESGPYAHLGADLRTSVTTFGGSESEAEVHQFAADYIELPDGGTFTFDGADEVSVGVEPVDGPFWWSDTGDAIDSRLTREVDLSGLDSATLTFRAWFDIEEGWDYAYVAVSEDGGDTWTALPGSATTDYDPVGNAYGPGYTGASGGWTDETIDLSAYAGKRILLRFEYVTDDGTHGRGLAIDDIAIPELDFADGADAAGDWTAEGFRRVEGPLEQRFALRLITMDDEPSVTQVTLSSGNTAEIPLGPTPSVLVVAAVTDGTTEPAPYVWSFRP